MTAVALTQRTARFRPARALRLEIKHSAVVWVLPVLAALFYVNAYRTAAGYPPTWTVRASVITGPNLIFFSVIAAGIAAWVATREGRRKTGDLLATTARAGWARHSIKPGDEVTIILCPAKNGQPVAYAGSGDPGTKVIFADGHELDFIDKTADKTAP